MKKERFEELDSIRGLAALSVVLLHLFTNIPIKNGVAVGSFTEKHWWGVFTNSPLHVFWAGSEAVVLFFILSGFVLSIPFLNENPTKEFSYKGYAIKRIFRIYTPYFVSLLLAFLMASAFSNSKIQGFVWKVPHGNEIVKHILLIFWFNSHDLNEVIWSLVHEMRISLIFPFVVFLIKRKSLKFNIFMAFGFSFIGLVGSYLSNAEYFYTFYFITFHYLAMFIFGALLAKHKKELISFYQRMNSIQKSSLFLVGILLYTYRYWLFPNVVYLHNFSHLEVAGNWIVTFGGSILIIIALGSNKMSKALRKRPVLFLGKISYSLYLIHITILFTLYSTLLNYMNLWEIWIVALILSIGMATLMYYFVELPSIKLGKRISSYFENNSFLKKESKVKKIS